jgi:RHS repeat-associated protein
VIGRVGSGGSSRRYYLKDHLGSIRAVLDGGGGARETRDYYPFGLPMPGRYEKGSPPTKEDYTGHVKDEETGLHYAGARYYSSAFGRWTTTDPILGEKGPKKLLKESRRLLSMSAYNYTYDNPVNLKDPDGRCPDCVVDLGFVAYDLYDIGSSIASGEGVSGTQVAALGGNLAGLAVPFATGGGAAVRGAMKADDLADAAKGLEKAGDAASATKKGEKTADAASGASKGGDELETVFRVYGGDSGAKGFSWTPKNPGNVSNFRDAAGLPSGANNTGRFVIRGKVKGSDIIKKRPADPLDGNSGGLMEYIIDPDNVKIERVSGANPEF